MWCMQTIYMLNNCSAIEDATFWFGCMCVCEVQLANYRPVYTTLSVRINANYFQPYLMRITQMRIKPVKAQSISRGSFNAH